MLHVKNLIPTPLKNQARKESKKPAYTVKLCYNRSLGNALKGPLDG